MKGSCVNVGIIMLTIGVCYSVSFKDWNDNCLTFA